jgi:magnesium chelatase family protein
MVTRYQVCLSGPMLDRVDLRVEVDAVSRTALLQQRDAPAESSAMVAARVLAARACRGPLRGRPLASQRRGARPRAAHPLSLGPEARRDAEREMERGFLSARGLDRVLRVAWTAADLVGSDRPHRAHV